jgi:hypothetical protein
VQFPRWSIVEEYLRAWSEALDQGEPALCLANTIEVRLLSGKTIGLIVLPWHPLRLAWHAGYDQLAVHARYEEGMSEKAVREMLHSLDSAQFPSVLPGLEAGQSFVFGDMLGFHSVAMVADSDPEPKAAIALMASCLAGGRMEVAPSVGKQSVQILAREVGNYLDCHTPAMSGNPGTSPNLLNVHAFKPGDGMTVCRALGEALRSRPVSETEGGDEDEQDLCYNLELFP